MNEERKLRAQRMRALAALVDPKKIQVSGVLTVVGGTAFIVGTFFTFNRSTDGALSISRNAYHMGSFLSDNGVGFIDSFLGLGLIVLGVSLLMGYRGYWFDPIKHVIAGVGTGVVVFDQKGYNSPTIPGINYTLGMGWYVCFAGAVLCVVAAFVRVPTKKTGELTQRLSS
jgi:hypothetical protein